MKLTGILWLAYKGSFPCPVYSSQAVEKGTLDGYLAKQDEQGKYLSFHKAWESTLEPENSPQSKIFTHSTYIGQGHSAYGFLIFGREIIDGHRVMALTQGEYDSVRSLEKIILVPEEESKKVGILNYVLPGGDIILVYDNPQKIRSLCKKEKDNFLTSFYPYTKQTINHYANLYRYHEYLYDDDLDELLIDVFKVYLLLQDKEIRKRIVPLVTKVDEPNIKRFLHRVKNQPYFDELYKILKEKGTEAEIKVLF